MVPLKSKVNPAFKAFMKGKKTAGKRTSAYSAAPKKKKKAEKKYKGAAGLANRTAGLIKVRSKKY